MVKTWLDEARKRQPIPVPPPLPARFLKATVASIENEHCQGIADEYLTAFWDVAPVGIAPVLIGPAQQWKSFTAAAICRVLHHHAKVQTDWVNCPVDLVLLDRYSTNGRSKLRTWIDVPFLVMDDFAAVDPRGQVLETLVAIASARFDAMHPTLWTGNIDGNGDEVREVLGRTFGPAFTRRLESGGGAFRLLV